MKRIFGFIFSGMMLLSFLYLGNITLAQENVENSVDESKISECLKGVGKDCFKMDKLLGVKENPDDNKTVISVVQDLILAATWAVGTVLTLVLIYCGVMYIIASGGDSGKASKLKKGMIDAGIGALLVRCAYGIVRLIQYIAQG